MFPIDDGSPSRADDDAVRKLRANDFVYQRLRREVQRRRDQGGPGLLPFIESVARFARLSHPGRLTDGALENILLDIGRDLDDAPRTALSDRPEPMPSHSRTLHVASEVHMTGGHSRVLAKWVQRDHASQAAIVVTRQPVELPAYLVLIAESRGVPITVLDRNEAILDRARQLRRLSQGFNRIILHHHPDDPVPVLAFAVPGGAPVAMFNHAHFWFSLGSGVADMIVNTMPYFRQLTERYRFPRMTDALDGPFGLDPLHWEKVDKWEAKARLGLAPDRPVIMSIGTESYFAPLGGVNFFNTLAKLLAARPGLQALLVGVREDSPLVPAHIRADKRVRLVGPVPDPRPYYRAADICLESFPMPSLGALTEAVTYGQAFPVPAFGEHESPLRVNQHHIASITDRPRTQAEYVHHVCELVDRPEAIFERAGNLRRTLIHDDERFGSQFASLYERIDRLGHVPHALPRTVCTVSPETLALASLTKPARIGEAINDLLPLRRALLAHLEAMLRGHEMPRKALVGGTRQIARTLFRRLPESLRRRLRSG